LICKGDCLKKLILLIFKTMSIKVLFYFKIEKQNGEDVMRNEIGVSTSSNIRYYFLRILIGEIPYLFLKLLEKLLWWL